MAVATPQGTGQEKKMKEAEMMNGVLLICIHVCLHLYLLLRHAGESSFCSPSNDVDSGLKEGETFCNKKKRKKKKNPALEGTFSKFLSLFHTVLKNKRKTEQKWNQE